MVSSPSVARSIVCPLLLSANRSLPLVEGCCPSPSATGGEERWNQAAPTQLAYEAIRLTVCGMFRRLLLVLCMVQPVLTTGVLLLLL